tara:strand:- start:8446 stop:8871 length:426 start_codon:yes stop_codon:yes gene_type:complete
MGDIKIIGSTPPSIEPGEYTAVYVFHETSKAAFGGKPKVYLTFRLIDPGVFGVELFAAFNVREITGKPKRYGGFGLSRRQELTYQLAKVLPEFRLDRPTLKPLVHKTLKVAVRTVVKDYKQRSLPLQLQYSVIDRMICITS